MYEEKTKGWFRHLDFIILDILSLRFSFFLIAAALLGINNVYSYSEVRNIGFVITFINIALIFIERQYSDVMRRKYIKEIFLITIHVIDITIWSYIYIKWFMPESIHDVGFNLLGLTMTFYWFLSGAVRFITKKIIKHNFQKRKNSIYIVTSENEAEWIINHIIKYNNKQYDIKGIFIFDKRVSLTDINGIKVINNQSEALDYLLSHWADEILFTSDSYSYFFAKNCEQMGITVHQQIAEDVDASDTQLLGRVGRQLVLTTTVKKISKLEAIEKRTLDIVGGIVGCVLTLIMFPLVSFAIKKESPGPAIYTQIRVGKNGKKFKMYKFRSMYLDADERKEELMNNNIVNDGKMFKLEFDPRVIGNKILPDGSRKTGVGDFIRRTSIDEFPQFFNVLKGDMSLVGTRPPTVEEVEKYTPAEKKRLTTRPGITGVWQISGRSNITDFDKVVKMDTEYIKNWNIWLDIKILFKTVFQVLKGKGAM